ncbi:hypothetical protein [Flagellimonas amoyensis]|uniref:hypothetical protein n=1 Tax=Flagellimonas amoyensis TaxID=2169401 RepID=UPI00131F194A|nr:hypothetical protein [Allomuricauda amoyensis]
MGTKTYPKIKSVVLIFMLCLCATGCTCAKKYTHLQAMYMESKALGQNMEDDYRRQLQEKDQQISELVAHIKRLNQQIKELEPK